MNKILMTLLLAGLALHLKAAEAVTPEVVTTDAPQVADPQLQDAVPVMRQGADEPVGGFKQRGRKGSNAVYFGLGQVDAFGPAVLGARYWMTDRLALQASLGGNYSDNNEQSIFRRSYETVLAEEIGLRGSLAEWGDAGFIFVDLRLGASQTQETIEQKTEQTGYTQFMKSDQVSSLYGAGLRLGAELFWPRSRRVSLEASAGLGAAWTYGKTILKNWSSDGVAGANNSSESSFINYEFGTRYSNLLVALNLYY